MILNGRRNPRVVRVSRGVYKLKPETKAQVKAKARKKKAGRPKSKRRARK